MSNPSSGPEQQPQAVSLESLITPTENYAADIANAAIPLNIREGIAYNEGVKRGDIAGQLLVASVQAEEHQALLAERDELREQATQNPVTGLYNEIGFSLRLAEIRARNPNLAIAIIEIDLGKFKAINDTLGHPVGDEILRTVGKALRKSDAETLVAHPHGDEFRIAAPLYARENPDLTNTERSDAIIGRVKQVGNILCQERPELAKLGFGISAGAAILEPGMVLEEVIPEADAALYADKAETASAAFKALPVRKRLAHHVGNALFRYSGTQPAR